MGVCKKLKIAILGAGPSGLGIGRILSKNNEIEVYEKTNKIGGMSSSFRYGKFMLDYGPHKLYSQIPGITEEIKKIIPEDLLEVEKKNSIVLKGKILSFPPKLSQILTKLNPTIGLKCGLSMIASKFKKYPGKSYETRLKKSFGEEMYNLLFKDIANKVWGDPSTLAEELAIKRVPLKSFGELIRSVLLGVKEKESAKHFYYPKDGLWVLCNNLKKEIESNKGKVSLNREITKINIKDNKITTIEFNNGEKKDIDYLSSTIPLHTLLPLMNPKPPEEVFTALKKLNYRGLTVLFIVINKPRVLKDSWIFFPEKEYIFSRVSEQKGFSEFTGPTNKTVLMIEIPKSKDFDLTEEEMYENVITQLEKLKLIDKDDIEEHFTKSAKLVYPIYSIDYKENLEVILNYLSTIKNLKSFGRQGLFNYNNIDHCLDMAIKTADHINKNEGSKEWKKLLKYFDGYTIVD